MRVKIEDENLEPSCESQLLAMLLSQYLDDGCEEGTTFYKSIPIAAAAIAAVKGSAR